MLINVLFNVLIFTETCAALRKILWRLSSSFVIFLECRIQGKWSWNGFNYIFGNLLSSKLTSPSIAGLWRYASMPNKKLSFISAFQNANVHNLKIASSTLTIQNQKDNCNVSMGVHRGQRAFHRGGRAVYLPVWHSHCTRARFTVLMSCSDQLAVKGGSRGATAPLKLTKAASITMTLYNSENSISSIRVISRPLLFHSSVAKYTSSLFSSETVLRLDYQILLKSPPPNICCVTITWQEIFKDSLQVTAVGVSPHVTVEHRHLGR